MNRLKEMLRLNRCGVLYYFTLEGCTIGLFTAYLPQIQNRLGLSDDRLGTAVFFFYLGQMIGTPAVAYALRTFGMKVSTFAGSVLFTALLVTISFATDFFSLCAIFLAFGIGECLLDVSMNALAILVETVAGYPIIGSFHGSYSVAAAVGAVIGGSLVSAGFIQLHVFAVLFASAFMTNTFFGVNMYSHKDELLVEKENVGMDSSLMGDDNRLTLTNGGSVSLKEVPSHEIDSFSENDNKKQGSVKSVTDTVSRSDSREKTYAANEESERVGKDSDGMNEQRVKGIKLLSMFMIPSTKVMISLAALAFIGAFGESAITTWIIIYTDREFDLHGDGTLIALTFSLFELFMGLGRYFVDTLRAHLGTKRMVLCAGVLASAGIAILVISPALSERRGKDSLAFVAACIGASCVGIGLSTIIPVSYISAGYTDGHTGTSIATVATWAGAGCLCSPPIVGILSSSFKSIRLAMSSLILFTIPLCALSFVLPPDKYTNANNMLTSTVDDHSITSTSSIPEDLTEPLIV